MSNLGTINPWLVIGFVIAIAYLLWQITALQKIIAQYIVINNTMMQGLDQMLMARDEEVDQKIERLEAQMEYINDKENSEVS